MNQTARPLTAFRWMLGAVASFVSMAVAGRELSTEMNTFELMFFRSIIGLVIISFFVRRSKTGFGQVRSKNITDHFIRNIVHFSGQNLWFYGIAVVPLSQLVAIEFTNPIWVALLAPLFLGEKMTKTKVAVAALGFTGVLIIAQPGVQPIHLGHLAGLGAAVGFALNTIMTRKLMRFDTVLCVLFWMTLMQSIMALGLSLPGGIPMPNMQTLPWLAVVAVAGLTAHYCLTMALSLAPATIVAPMEFIRLPIIALLGMALYREPLMLSVFIGAAFILAGNIINLKSKS